MILQYAKNIPLIVGQLFSRRLGAGQLAFHG